jgi:hypothetical protein
MHTEFLWRNFLENSHLEDVEIRVDDIKMNFGERSCENGRCLELAQDHVQWQAFVLVALNHTFC